MSEVRPIYDDEIDLFEFFETLWVGKWKIIATTFVSAVIGVVFSVVKPNYFEVTTPIRSGKQSVFTQYTQLNDLLSMNDLIDNSGSYIIDSASVFKMFISEFYDYEEMIYAVSKSEFVQKSIEDLDEVGKQRELINFAKAFKLRGPRKKGQDYTFYFKWRDALEGKRLLNEATRQILLNIKDVKQANINNLAETIDIRNSRNIEKLSNKLSLIEENQIDRYKKRIQYLREKSAIAKELGIETNILDANSLSRSSKNSVSLSVNSNNIPFYLRGYKAIDKEIAQMVNRSYEDKLLRADGYIQTKEEIASLESDLTSSQLRNALEAVAKFNPNRWVEVDVKLSDVKSLKKSKRQVALSIVLGGIVGVIYVLISSAISNKKGSSAKA